MDKNQHEGRLGTCAWSNNKISVFLCFLYFKISSGVVTSVYAKYIQNYYLFKKMTQGEILTLVQNQMICI